MATKRLKFLIDQPIQIGLVTRIVFHWALFLLAATLCLPLVRAVIYRDFSTPLNERFSTACTDAGILFCVFLILSPYLIFDTFKLTNRFAGPMYRLRNSISSIAAGEPPRPIEFRKGDYWYDVASQFNTMVQRLQESSSDSAVTGKDQEPLGV